MRALGVALALSCEMATTERCRCRCGGALHGARRARNDTELVELGSADPHFPFTSDTSPAGEGPPRVPAGQQSLDEALHRALVADLLAP